MLNRLSHPDAPNLILFFLIFFNVYLFLKKREIEHEQGRGRERVGDTESEMGSRL